MTTVESDAASFDETLQLFTEQLGYRLAMVTPADDPSLAVVERDGHQVAIKRAGRTALDRGYELPELRPARHIATVSDAAWVIGRAGMRYRDLIADRLGGRFIASHIEVCDGGPVPDLVHHHAIRFQLIVCQRGWVDVVYQDQGPPFRMEAGDVVLQPPHIRHRVLASSAGARVVEIGCPAEHDTLFDHELELPTPSLIPDRDFGGQRFVWHRGSTNDWQRSRFDGFDAQITAVAVATDGLADVRFLRPGSADGFKASAEAGEFHFVFVMAGTASLQVGEASVDAGEGLAVTLAPDDDWAVTDASSDLRLLEVRLPA